MSKIYLWNITLQNFVVVYGLSIFISVPIRLCNFSYFGICFCFGSEAGWRLDLVICYGTVQLNPHNILRIYIKCASSGCDGFDMNLFTVCENHSILMLLLVTSRLGAPGC